MEVDVALRRLGAEVGRRRAEPDARLLCCGRGSGEGAAKDGLCPAEVGMWGVGGGGAECAGQRGEEAWCYLELFCRHDGH